MSTLAQVVSAVVHNNRSANDAVWSKQLHQDILLSTLGNTGGVSGDVTQVSNVSVVILWSTVLLTEWVEVRTSRSTSVGVVTKSVDVETSQSGGIVTGDFPRDGGWVRLGDLLEVDDSRNGFISSEDGDW